METEGRPDCFIAYLNFLNELTELGVENKRLGLEPKYGDALIGAWYSNHIEEDNFSQD